MTTGHKVTLRVIPPPDKGTRTVFVTKPGMPEDFLFIDGDSPGWSYDCGQCGRLLIRDVHPDEIGDLVLKCPRCGAYNEASILPGRRHR